MKIPVLVCHDLWVALKNQSIYPLILIPLLVSLTFELVEDGTSADQRVSIGLLRNERYPAALLQALESAPPQLSYRWFPELNEATNSLKDNGIDGVLSVTSDNRLQLMVKEQVSIRTAAIIQTFSALQASAEKHPPAWIAEVKSLSPSSLAQTSCATWVLSMVLLVGFLIIPMQVAEEKEKQLLHSLLSTPIRETHWLGAKVLTGMLLASGSVGLLHALNRVTVTNLIGYIIMVLVGSFCFSAIGVLLGMLCRTQAGARSFGLLAYLPNLLPSALRDFSQSFDWMARALPSQYFFDPIRQLLLEPGLKLSQFGLDSGVLLIAGLCSCKLSLRLLSRRWKM